MCRTCHISCAFVSLFAVISLFLSTAHADEIFFIENPGGSESLATSWGFYSGDSFLQLAEDYGLGEGKFPVQSPSYKALHSLLLKWRSAIDGDWGLAVASEQWEPRDTTKTDALRFHVNGTLAIDRKMLPDIALEDTSNHKSSRIWLGDYLRGLDGRTDTWQSVSIPMNAFQPGVDRCDLRNIKTIYFLQRLPATNEYELWIDNLRMHQPGTELASPTAPENIKGTGAHLRADLRWEPAPPGTIIGYNVYRSDSKDGPFVRINDERAPAHVYSDFVGTNDLTLYYRVTSMNEEFEESVPSEIVSATTRAMTDEELLTSVQEATFRYFWDFAHPVSGLAREASDFSADLCAIGGSGMGIMNIVVGTERGFVTRDEAVQRLLKITGFLGNQADRFHGAWPHFLNGTTGKTIPFSEFDDGGDLVETAFMIQGLLTARQYFDKETAEEQELRQRITDLWASVEWDWYQQDPEDKVLYWHWSPNHEWRINHALRGYNEVMIVYLLAIAAPSHSVPASLYYDGWANNYWYENDNVYYGRRIWVGPEYGGPLFFTHYSFLGFDPRNKKDRYCNYFENSRNIALVHRAYGIENPGGFQDYSGLVWGMTASRNPFGYNAHAPGEMDNGTITPTAALSSMPYTPEESMATLRYLYEHYGPRLWGPFGFKDAFNPTENWFADGYLAIDQGTIVPMIENYRTGLCWDMFMSNPEIQPMLDAIGWEQTPSAPENL